MANAFPCASNDREFKRNASLPLRLGVLRVRPFCSRLHFQISHRRGRWAFDAVLVCASPLPLSVVTGIKVNWLRIAGGHKWNVLRWINRKRSLEFDGGLYSRSTAIVIQARSPSKKLHGMRNRGNGVAPFRLRRFIPTSPGFMAKTHWTRSSDALILYRF